MMKILDSIKPDMCLDIMHADLWVRASIISPNKPPFRDGWGGGGGANQSSFQSKVGFAFQRRGFCALRHNCKYAHRCSSCRDTRHNSSACQRQVFSGQNINPNFHFVAKSENKVDNFTPNS